jgi:hypothetical protein
MKNFKFKITKFKMYTQDVLYVYWKAYVSIPLGMKVFS